MMVNHVLEALHLPTDEELGQHSVVLGHFQYPPKREFADEGEWADACAELEADLRETVAATLSENGFDTTNFEIRLSEMGPGEIRLYP